MKNISFMLTQPQVMAGTKTVTRRLGWKNLKPGDILQGVRKGMGLKPGERIHKLRRVEVASVTREPLNRIVEDLDYGYEEVVKEGFPKMDPLEFAEFFCASHKGCRLDTEVTRIEFSHAITTAGPNVLPVSVSLGFNPDNPGTPDLKAIFSDEIALSLWCQIKRYHLVGQHFEAHLLRVADVLREHPPEFVSEMLEMLRETSPHYKRKRSDKQDAALSRPWSHHLRLPAEPFTNHQHHRDLLDYVTQRKTMILSFP